MNRFFLILLIFIGLSNWASAQDFETGVSNDEIEMAKYDKDPQANAVFLNEFGNTRIDEYMDHIRLIHTYHAKIKIFTKEGLKHGTIEIPIHNGDNSAEEVNNVTGFTYYKDDNGIIQKAEFESKKVYTVKDYKYGSTVKFALPALRPGCVIEFKYELISPYWDHFRGWTFQDDIPKINSQYEVHIPGFWNFNASIRGVLKLTKSTSEVERECFSSGGSKADCSHITYDMKDIPAFVDEDFMTARKNFLSAIYFELVEFTNPYTSVKTVVTKEWSDVDRQLKIADEFGSQVKRTSLLKERIASVIAGKTDELDKAKTLYAWIKSQIKWNDYIGIYSSEGEKKALDTHSGSIADINLTLITALNAAGLNAEAVLLSTRDHGMVNTLYPVLTDFNYVIARLTIGEQTYLLDATDPLLSFGLLPLKCINDKGRVISMTKPSYWMELSTQQKAATTHMFDLTLLENGKLKGSIVNYYKGYDAYEKRKAIKKFNSIDEYVEDFDEKQPKLKVLKSDITNLDSLESPLRETFEVEIDAFDNTNHDKLAFNPYFWEKRTTNPFKLAERDYPVDWAYASDKRLVLIMHLPAQYTVETPPQVVAYSLPNKGGMFATTFENQDNNTFTFSNITQFNKSVYDPAEYPYLKELFNKIILTEKGDMIFKKK
ncbi:DUF3857 domain-containing protein [Mucilaginibacter rubeus]|uniref:DUF3857 domain-containing protein n=1 Tax=Mucilaginibacter rubeus TaxID=2027860 RepID=A0A5C1I177_9SPHI|nr:DUF3857 domain-containing protein [Mucilaginibacter rubeus]QEM11038.1 DUF3857 domain-containing protein [Mucilaginibacter rubeus]